LKLFESQSRISNVVSKRVGFRRKRLAHYSFLLQSLNIGAAALLFSEYLPIRVRSTDREDRFWTAGAVEPPVSEGTHAAKIMSRASCRRRDSPTKDFPRKLEMMPRLRKKKHQTTKKACSCGHGIAIHHLDRNTRGKHRCWHPGCQCKDYNPLAQPALPHRAFHTTKN
jgi:hypothetical protein